MTMSFFLVVTLGPFVATMFRPAGPKKFFPPTFHSFLCTLGAATSSSYEHVRSAVRLCYFEPILELVVVES